MIRVEMSKVHKILCSKSMQTLQPFSYHIGCVTQARNCCAYKKGVQSWKAAHLPTSGQDYAGQRFAGQDFAVSGFRFQFWFRETNWSKVSVSTKTKKVVFLVHYKKA